MRILIVNPVFGLDHNYNEDCRKYLSEYLAQSTKIDFCGLNRGFPSVETETQNIINGSETLKLLMDIEQTNYDGVFINCFDDPAITAAKEILRIPVSGPYLPSVLYASAISERIAIISTEEYGVLCEERKAQAHGLASKITSIVNIDLGVLELKDGGLEDKLEKCVEDLYSQGIRAAVLGCTGMQFAAETVQKKIGPKFQIIEPLRTGVKFLESVIALGNTNIIGDVPLEIKTLKI